MNTNKKTQMIVEMGLLTAIIIVLQVLTSVIKPSGIFAITLALTPIVIGAALHGWLAGAWLGFVFGLGVLISGDANPFLAVNAAGTIITVLAKGACAGAAAGAVYKLFEKVNSYVAVLLAAIVCPIVNTGIFVIGCFLFFMDTITLWAEGADAITYIFVGMIGINFLIEMGVNIVLSSGTNYIIRLVKKTR